MPECLNPGTANPDIAGLGVSRDGQSCPFATLTIFSHHHRICGPRGDICCSCHRFGRDDPTFLFGLPIAPRLLRAEHGRRTGGVTKVVQLIRSFPDSLTNIIQKPLAGQWKRTMRALERGNFKEAIQSLAGLYGQRDAAGPGFVSRFINMVTAQGLRIGLSRVQRLAYLQGMATKPGIAQDLSGDVEARIEIVNGILIAVSDAQLISGMSVSGKGGGNRDRADLGVSLYHFHIIYDMTNFTA
jgi:hypothetical protein